MKISISRLLLLLVSFCGIQVRASNNDQLLDKIQGAVVAAALGDALGRATEFLGNTQEIYQRYGPHGVTSFGSFKPDDFVVQKDGKRIGAYTDDTVMARIVLRTATACKGKQQSIQEYANQLAHAFADLFGPNKCTIDPLYHVRGHGSRNRAAGRWLNEHKGVMQKNAPWWLNTDTHIANEGGCGSVMRAWPIGIVYKDNLDSLQVAADMQSRITHRHPMACAASVAIAIGVAHALNNASPQKIGETMRDAAALYDSAESKLRPARVGMGNVQIHIAQGSVKTSELIDYALLAARVGLAPDAVLGTDNEKSPDTQRSPNGWLLGWAADEAIAAATYVFMRHPDDLQTALAEAVNTPGDSDSIATLVGALVGARVGYKQIVQQFADLGLLEDLDGLLADARLTHALICK